MINNPLINIIKKYKVNFEMFVEEVNGGVKTQELERMMSLIGINPTKTELIQMAKDVDKEDTLFNCESFLGLMVLYHERTKNQDSELRAAFRVFDKEGKRYNCTIIPTVSHIKKVETNNNDFIFIFSEFVAMFTGNLFKMT
uniref:Calmodulin like 6 n=1 Tax=Neolamprologus brichardi TaxID=32507 RepID=A0A3Q4HSA1_NEOBR